MIAAEGAAPDGAERDTLSQPYAPSRRIAAPTATGADPAVSRTAGTPTPRPHRHGALLRYY
ncbi:MULTISPECIES: hypothetical protein [Bacteria]|uniref:hypothetical protein n=1 Tax=Bacteria TaxID=2 RepID=UPI003C7A2927